MAKVRKVSQAFEGTRGIPGQYTTDPEVAKPEQIAAIGSALDKANRLKKGATIVTPMKRVSPIPTQPTTVNRSGGGNLRAPAGAANSGLGGAAPIATAPVGMNATSKGSRRAPGAFGAGLRGGEGTLRIAPNVDKLTPTEAASLKMLEASLLAKEVSPSEDEDFALLRVTTRTIDEFAGHAGATE